MSDMDKDARRIDARLEAGLRALPRKEPGASFAPRVLAALGRRRASVPLWPLAGLFASAASVVAALTLVDVSVPRAAAAFARAAGAAEVFLRLGASALPDALGGLELGASAVLGAALFLTLTLPKAVPQGAKR